MTKGFSVSKKDYIDYLNETGQQYRITEDFTHVKLTDHVFEIMYQYYNSETSLPYPEKRKVSEIPAGVRIWAIESNCQKECNRLKNKLKKQDPEVIGPGRKILPL